LHYLLPFCLTKGKEEREAKINQSSIYNEEMTLWRRLSRSLTDSSYTEDEEQPQAHHSRKYGMTVLHDPGNAIVE
jgi:hypothetical protein